VQLITNSFVLVAPDTKTAAAVVPQPKGGKDTMPVIQHDLLTNRPYALTLEELIFETHVRRLGLSAAEAKARKTAIWKELFAKSHACMRASALPKQYGWGVHYDEKGRIALVPMESDAYRRFAAGEVEGVEVTQAMRTRRTRD
jgi:hypothetical protein